MQRSETNHPDRSGSSEEFRRAVEAIKLRAPIEDVVRERVPSLKKTGALWVACCPFHEERTPSFKVDPRRGHWRCYGACGTWGDQISFIERFDNLQFMDALEILAARTGVEIPRRSATRPEDSGAADKLFGLLEAAGRFYQAQLRTAEGQASARYLRARGLTDVTADAFGIGHAPARGQAFVELAREQGFALADCEKVGLVRHTDEGRPYDFFRGRLMIPIRDARGRTIGFGARRLVDEDESGPKYINTAETELFRKGRLVYAFDRALPVVRRSGHIVLVEGYTDVMAAHQVGLSNVVAVLGTATTDDHAALIKKSGARRVSLVFDGDEAGRKAAYKALHGILPLEVEIDVVSLPGGDDPCDLLVREGASAFTAQLEQAQDWFDFLVAGTGGLRGMELSREVDRVLELLTRLSKPVHRDARIQELAGRLGLPAQSLLAQHSDLPVVRAERRAQGARASDSARQAAAPRDERTAPARERTALQAELLGAVLLDSSLWRAAEVQLEGCADAELVRIADAIAMLYEEGDSEITESSVMTALGADEPARNRVARLAPPGEIESLKEHFDGLIGKLELAELLRRKAALLAEYVALPDASGDEAERAAVLEKERDLQHKLGIVQQHIARVAPPTPVLPNARPQVSTHG